MTTTARAARDIRRDATASSLTLFSLRLQVPGPAAVPFTCAAATFAATAVTQDIARHTIKPIWPICLRIYACASPIITSHRCLHNGAKH